MSTTARYCVLHTAGGRATEGLADVQDETDNRPLRWIPSMRASEGTSGRNGRNTSYDAET